MHNNGLNADRTPSTDAAQQGGRMKNCPTRAGRWWFCLALLTLAGPGWLTAGEFNPDISIGDPAPAWKELPGTDGKRHSLSDLKDRAVVIVAFTCNSCPYAVDYEDRLIALAKRHAGPDSPVAVVAINVNTVEEDRLPQMKARAGQKGFPFPYLFDESQQIAKDYGAAFTPEFFVLNRERKIAYMGALDDNPDATKATRRFVDEAVAALLSNGDIQRRETAPIGCRIRYERAKRTRKPQ